jgi:hypothetical protein
MVRHSRPQRVCGDQLPGVLDEMYLLSSLEAQSKGIKITLRRLRGGPGRGAPAPASLVMYSRTSDSVRVDRLQILLQHYI